MFSAHRPHTEKVSDSKQHFLHVEHALRFSLSLLFARKQFSLSKVVTNFPFSFSAQQKLN